MCSEIVRRRKTLARLDAEAAIAPYQELLLANGLTERRHDVVISHEALAALIHTVKIQGAVEAVTKLKENPPTVEDNIAAIVRKVIKEELRVEEHRPYFTAPNSRYFEVKLGDTTVTAFSFDVNSRPEYEG